MIKKQVKFYIEEVKYTLGEVLYGKGKLPTVALNLFLENMQHDVTRKTLRPTEKEALNAGDTLCKRIEKHGVETSTAELFSYIYHKNKDGSEAYSLEINP